MEAIQKKKQRDSSIELFRIITMLMIVAHHYIVNSGVLSEINHDNILCSRIQTEKTPRT